MRYASRITHHALRNYPFLFNFPVLLTYFSPMLNTMRPRGIVIKPVIRSNIIELFNSKIPVPSIMARLIAFRV